MAATIGASCAKKLLKLFKFFTCFYSLLLFVTSQKVDEYSYYPFRNISLSWDERLDDLIGRILLDDMVLQMARGGALKNSSPGINRDHLGIRPYNWNTECLRGDAFAGNATAFPQALGLAAAFSRELIHDVARATAYEVRAKHNNCTKHDDCSDHMGLSCFSPVLNIMRHPLWGRNQETYGEDPYMTGEFARSFIHGLQGDHPRYIITNAGCKHFDVHSGPENIPESRFTFDAEVSDYDWYTTYLPQFHECVKAGTYSFMCSYNKINGVPACGNKKLLTDILRKKWGFKGYVVSDQKAVEYIYKEHNYTKTPLETAVLAVKAGCNLELCVNPDNVFMHITEAVQLGLLTMDDVMQGVRPLFYTRMRLGEFDPIKDNPYAQLHVDDVVECQKHRELAVRAAVKSFVLLKNNDKVLPVKKIKTLAIIGPFANSSDELFGSYAAQTRPEYIETPLQGLSKIAQKTQFAAGCDNPKCANYNKAEVTTALKMADFVVVCLGTGTSIEKEGNDRISLQLPDNQKQLLTDAMQLAAGKPLVLLLFNAGPLAISWIVEDARVHTIVECGFPAQATGEALRLMFTNAKGANPGGRLPATWPKSIAQVPPITEYGMTGRTYRYFFGYPLFPFGYGLSFTNFTYKDIQVQPATIQSCDNVTVSVMLYNVGKYTGDEVTQVYITYPDTGLDPRPPDIQLVNFNRTEELPAQSSVRLSFLITPRVKAFYTWDYVIWPGVYKVYVGGQQPGQKVQVDSNVLQGSFTIDDYVNPLSSCKYPG